MNNLLVSDKITCLSRELCIAIAEDGVVTDLYVFLGSLNRSELHRDFLVEGTTILLNMTKCAETTRYVWQVRLNPLPPSDVVRIQKNLF